MAEMEIGANKTSNSSLHTYIQMWSYITSDTHMIQHKKYAREHSTISHFNHIKSNPNQIHNIMAITNHNISHL